MKMLLGWLNRHFEEYIMIALLGAMVILMCMHVFLRYVLSYSLSWPEEMIRYMFIWFVFTGMSYGIRENIHLRVDLLETGLPRLKPYLNALQDVFFLAFCAYMLRPALSGVGALIRTGKTSAAMNLPMYWVYSSLLLGFFLSLVRLIQKYALLALRARGKGDEE